MDYTHARSFDHSQPLNDSPLQQHQQQRQRQQLGKPHQPIFLNDNDSSGVQRKDSTMTTSAVMSPVESQHHVWDQQHYTTALPAESLLTVDPSSQYCDDGHTFMAPSLSHQSAFAQPAMHQQWSVTTGTVIPGFAADYVSNQPQFGHGQYADQTMAATHAAWTDTHMSHPQMESQPATHTVQPNYLQGSLSPHEIVDHMALAEQEAGQRQNTRRLHSRTPQRTVLGARQGDGIRKKNNRIPIPEGRNIHNIDALIDNADDEGLVIELKQQKRLLRNRDAALTSRQRKKAYTEQLEFTVKQNTVQLKAYESEFARLESLEPILKTSQDQVALLQQEKMELIEQHTLETTELRRRIRALEDRLEAGPAPSMSAVPSSTGFTELNASIAALHFSGYEQSTNQEWNDFIDINEMAEDYQDPSLFDNAQSHIEPERGLEQKASVATLVPSGQGKTESATDQPVASSLLFMILLCGALFASKPTSSQTPSMPVVPQMVRSAASDILQVLLDSDLSTSHHAIHTSLGAARETMQTGNVRASAVKSTPMDNSYHGQTTSTQHLDSHDALGLTSSQYTSLTSPDYAEATPDYNVGRRSRNLAQALMDLERKHAQGNNADVYVRSLLWDHIPEQVIQEFKEMVRDHQNVEGHQDQGRPFATASPLDMMYKPEP